MRRYGIHNLGILSVPEQAAGFPGLTYTQRVEATGPIAYWVMGEAAGATSIDQINSPLQDGTYTAVTLGQPGIGDGNTCPSFDGATSFNNVYSAVLAGVFSGTLGSCLIWCKVNSVADWTDGIARNGIQLLADGNNYFAMRKSAANNEWTFIYRAGGTLDFYNHVYSNVGWFMSTITWNQAADRLRYYLNATPVGNDAGVGIWAGPLSVTQSTIGSASTVPAFVWNGTLAHCAVWNRELDPAEITGLAAV